MEGTINSIKHLLFRNFLWNLRDHGSFLGICLHDNNFKNTADLLQYIVEAAGYNANLFHNYKERKQTLLSNPLFNKKTRACS